MIEITLGHSDLNFLRESLLGRDSEHAAVLLAAQTTRSDGLIRLLVQECHTPTPDDYLSQGLYHVVLKPAFVARVTKRAKWNELSLIFVHSHPGPSAPRFSLVDDEGERHLADFLSHRHPAYAHGSMVLSEGGLLARRLGTRDEIRVVSLGEHRVVSFADEPHGNISEVFDRQVRAFGADGQRILERLHVAIVGLGGTGSLVAQQLAHLGVRRFLLIDPDVIESTNLNRLVGASSNDVGSAKVDVASRSIERIASEAVVVRLQADIIRAKTALTLRDADIVFGCTDSHGSRAVLQQIAYQYLIPCIDMGTTITTNGSAVSGVFGRVQLLGPGFACFSCSGLLDPEEVRRDMMTAFERKLDPYVQGIREPAPSVISLNGTVASLAVTMFMAYVAGMPSPARYIVYNALNSTLRFVHADPKSDCYICARSGVFARGDSQRLFTRQD